MSLLKSKDELAAIFQQAGIQVQDERDIITTCGSGVTACTLVAGLEYCGRDPSKTFVYDGSWVEYGRDDSGTPVETSQ